MSQRHLSGTAIFSALPRNGDCRMNLPCSHWSSCDRNYGGCCAIKEFGATVSPMTCLKHCTKYDGPERTAELIQRLTVDGETVSHPATGPPRQHHHWWIPRLVRFGRFCCGKPNVPNDHAPQYRWLFVLWYGWPKPLRLRWYPAPPRVLLVEMPGCGCIIWLKDLWDWLNKVVPYNPAVKSQ